MGMKYSVGCQCCEPPCTMPTIFCYVNNDPYNQWDMTGTMSYYKTPPSWLPTYETPPLQHPFNAFPGFYMSVASGYNPWQTASLPLSYPGWYSCPQLQMTCYYNTSWVMPYPSNIFTSTVTWKGVDRYYYYLFLPTGNLADSKYPGNALWLHQYIVRTCHITMDTPWGFGGQPAFQEMTKTNVVLYSGAKRWLFSGIPDFSDGCRTFYCHGTDVYISGYGTSQTGYQGNPQYECPGLGSSTPTGYIPWIANIQPFYGYDFGCVDAIAESRPVFELADCDVHLGGIQISLCGGVSVGGNSDVTVGHVKVGPQTPIIGGITTKDSSGNEVSVVDAGGFVFLGGEAVGVGSVIGGEAGLEVVGHGNGLVVASGGILCGSGNILSGFISSYVHLKASGGVVLAGTATLIGLGGDDGGGGGGFG